MDVTYIHIPSYGWHDTVAVIECYPRHLPASRLTTSYSAAEVRIAFPGHAAKLAQF